MMASLANPRVRLVFHSSCTRGRLTFSLFISLFPGFFVSPLCFCSPISLTPFSRCRLVFYEFFFHPEACIFLNSFSLWFPLHSIQYPSRFVLDSFALSLTFLLLRFHLLRLAFIASSVLDSFRGSVRFEKLVRTPFNSGYILVSLVIAIVIIDFILWPFCTEM